MISLEDVVGLKYLGKWSWSPNGRFISYLWDDGGVVDLWMAEPGVSEPKRLTWAKKGVTDLSWRPGTGDLYFVEDGGLRRAAAAADEFHVQPLLHSAKSLQSLAWSPDGATLAFTREGRTWFYEPETQSYRELELPGSLIRAGRNFGTVLWSPSSRTFAYGFRDDETRRQFGVATRDGTVLWQSSFDVSAGRLAWLDDDTLYFALQGYLKESADFMSLSLSGEKPEVNLIRHIQGNGKVEIYFTDAYPSPDGSKVLFLLEDDGWAHHYLLDREDGSLKQLTFGQCEDFGYIGDAPMWWPDSGSFAFSSNRGSLGERRIFRYSLDMQSDHVLIDLPGTNTDLKVSSQGRLAFVHCDATRNMDLWVAGPNGENPSQVTFSMPPAWTRESQYEPEEVSFESNGGMRAHGYLMRPKDIAAGAKLPGLVWLHGGPIRQFRRGWHPLQTYAIYHAINQYLVQSGYVVLSLNYRGGIGYGREFRNALYHKIGIDDVADVANAGRFLKTLPFVDPDNVGLWGLSYGGFMTLHCLAQHPDVYKCGVNVAGMWNFVQYIKWFESWAGKHSCFFKIFLGGDPEESPEMHRQASPHTHVRGLRAPLLSVHGTMDANVDFEQVERIIEDCVEHGKYHEEICYPGELHTFVRRKTWLDAIPKIAAFLGRYLKKGSF